jgi:voltage-gated potassium channel
MLLAFAGEVVVFYLFYLLIDYFLSGRIYEVIHGVRNMADVKRMKKHYVITGAGRVGLEVATNLKSKRKKFVMIENNHDAYERASAFGYNIIFGDCTHHDILEEANVNNASCVITTLGDDPDNVFVTLAVKQMAPDVQVISRAERKDTIEKLKQAGADSVFMPSSIGGQAMARAAMDVTK